MEGDDCGVAGGCGEMLHIVLILLEGVLEGVVEVEGGAVGEQGYAEEGEKPFYAIAIFLTHLDQAIYFV